MPQMHKQAAQPRAAAEPFLESPSLEGWEVHLGGPKDELLCHAAAHADIDVRRHLLPRPAVLILLRRLQPGTGGRECWHSNFSDSIDVSRVHSQASRPQSPLKPWLNCRHAVGCTWNYNQHYLSFEH